MLLGKRLWLGNQFIPHFLRVWKCHVKPLQKLTILEWVICFCHIHEFLRHFTCWAIDTKVNRQWERFPHLFRFPENLEGIVSFVLFFLILPDIPNMVVSLEEFWANWFLKLLTMQNLYKVGANTKTLWFIPKNLQLNWGIHMQVSLLLILYKACDKLITEESLLSFSYVWKVLSSIRLSMK
jgi:hypothetical protein